MLSVGLCKSGISSSNNNTTDRNILLAFLFVVLRYEITEVTTNKFRNQQLKRLRVRYLLRIILRNVATSSESSRIALCRSSALISDAPRERLGGYWLDMEL